MTRLTAYLERLTVSRRLLVLTALAVLAMLALWGAISPAALPLQQLGGRSDEHPQSASAILSELRYELMAMQQRLDELIHAESAAKRALMVERLGAMGIGVPCPPEGALYCFADVSGLPPALANGMDFFRAALDERVICVPGEFFDVNPGKRRMGRPSRFRHHVRFSFGPDMEVIETALARLGEMIRSHR